MINDCCKNSDNMVRQPSDKPEMIINKCKKCGRNHYRLMAEPIILGAQIQPLKSR
jgi:hypothetical protein